MFFTLTLPFCFKSIFFFLQAQYSSLSSSVAILQPPFPSFSTLLLYNHLPSTTPFSVLLTKRDAVSLCKCQFVSSEEERESKTDRVYVERCHSLFCPFTLREAMEELQPKDWGRKIHRGLMVSDELGDSSKICL